MGRLGNYSRTLKSFLIGFLFGSMFLLIYHAQYEQSSHNVPQTILTTHPICLEHNREPSVSKRKETQEITVQKQYTEKNDVQNLLRMNNRVVDDPFDAVEKLQTRDDNFWEMAPHYNVDDYGVPVEEHVLSVDSMKDLTPAERAKTFKERGIKTVLYYHSAYGSTTYGFNYKEVAKQGQLPYVMKGCKRRDCFCTDRRDFLPIEEFDAILFYSRLVSKVDLPKVRKPHQRYILWEVESATYLLGFDPKQWPNFFNWTHTYRRDSDFWEPWGIITQYKKLPKPMSELIEDTKKNISSVEQKKKGIAWFVSNCNARSGRDAFAKELSKHIQVDIYGGCGTLKCDRSQTGKCWEMVERDYYFYFSAENSRCKDYITEKFYSALKFNIVPIVFGGASNENDYYLAPPKSHINVDDFKSPEELAIFLKSLMAKKEDYISYFWWKPYYRSWLGRWKKTHCEICDKLHDKNEPVKIYENMYDWWVTQGKCR